MKLLKPTVSLLVLLLSELSYAQTWTSPDGFIALTPPDASKFQEVANPPPPFLGLWISNDELMKFGLMTMEIPANVKLIQSSLEEGLKKEVGGSVKRLPNKTIAGHEVLCMSAKGKFGEITQLIIRHNTYVYKLMAVNSGSAGGSESVNQFIDSLSIAIPAIQPEDKLVGSSSGAVESSDLFHELSKKIGGLSILVLMGLSIYFFILRKPPTEPHRTES